jgi:anti-sigma factor RsiW
MNTPVTEAELQAWADGRLAPPRRAAVDAYLLLHPADAARLQAYREQNIALRARYNPLLDEPLPAGLGERPPARRAADAWQAARHWPARMLSRALDSDAANDSLLPAARAAATLLLVLASGAGGWLLRDRTGAHEDDSERAAAAAVASLPQRAAVAHAVYTPEVRHPVEVGAADSAHLVAWLSKRLGAPLRPPQLDALGYALEGGRLLPGQSGPVAQFMYRDNAGARLTLYVSTEQGQNQETAFRYAQEGPLRVFYWIDGRFGYALSGALPKAALGKIADAVYAQLEPAS